MIEHENMNLTDENDQLEARQALESLLDGAKSMIDLTERHCFAGERSGETLVIPLDLDHEISIMITKDYIAGNRH
jgi:hypothetical protein